MIIRQLPDTDNNVPARRIRLKSSGIEIRPDLDTRRVWVSTEHEAAELIAEGWERVSSKSADAETLRKGSTSPADAPVSRRSLTRSLMAMIFVVRKKVNFVTPHTANLRIASWPTLER